MENRENRIMEEYGKGDMRVEEGKKREKKKVRKEEWKVKM